jgi:hypothetical protein
LAPHLHTSHMGRCRLPRIHVWKFCFEGIFRALVSCCTSDRVHGGLVGVHQQFISWPQQIRQLECGVRGTARRRDGRRRTLASGASSDLVPKVLPFLHMRIASADWSLVILADVDMPKMTTYST